MTEADKIQEELRHNEIVQELIEIRIMQIKIMQKLNDCTCKGEEHETE